MLEIDQTIQKISEVRAGDDWDPDLDDYHHPPVKDIEPTDRRRLLDDARDYSEREAKIAKLLDGLPLSHQRAGGERGKSAGRGGSSRVDSPYAFALSDEDAADKITGRRFEEHKAHYTEHGVSKEVLEFGAHRNVFCEDNLNEAGEQALAITTASRVKQGRKEVFLAHLPAEHRELFTDKGGADEKEWKSWLDLDACEVMTEEESERAIARNSDLTIPSKWVRTNKNEGTQSTEFLAKSRLPVQGFRD